MQLKQKCSSLFIQLLALPKRYTLPAAAVIIGGLLYVCAFVVEKPVTFSYAEKSCVNRTTLLPDTHAVAGSADYEVIPSRLIKVGDWAVAARSLCFTPMHAPQVGTAKVKYAPFGGVVASRTFALNVPAPVVADGKVFDVPIPVSKPLHIKLTGVDAVFDYALKVGDKMAECTPKPDGISCNIQKLGLAQSQAYQVELARYFNKKLIATVISKKIQTLSATSLTTTSIKQNELVYSKPTDINLVFDKKLVALSSDLYKVEEGVRTKVPSTATTSDTGAVITLSDQLARSMEYQLVVNKVEAIDGSSLVEPYRLTFKTSGGPKVTSVSAGSTGVPMGATVVVTFDQALSDKQDISKFVSLSGGVSLINKQGNQLRLSVNGVAQCGDFAIKLTNDLQSQYDIAGNSAWRYAGRTICYTIGTIGTSTQGRPINAYYFGSGATSVLYTGAIHGSEASTKTLMERWIQDLDAKARTIPAHISVVVVPMINPDGIARGSRTNANNVDLNRNFATSDWQKDITTVNNQPFPGGGGESAMSEPEIKAISTLAQRLRPKVILSYHSIGSVVAANQAGNSAGLATTYSQLSGYSNITGQSDSTFEYSVTGTADDWYAQAIGIPSLLIELGSHSYHQFERNQAAMWAMINS